MMRRLVLCVALLVTGCASHEALFRPAPVATVAVDAPFSASGRLSVRFDGRGQMARFEWAHRSDGDELLVNSPIGTTVARLTRDADGVTLEADGKTWKAPDVETLTETRLGFTLPLANLVWWIRGRAAPGAPATFGEDGSLLQQGWLIRFVADQPGAPYPKRVDLSRGDLSIRLVTDRWQ